MPSRAPPHLRNRGGSFMRALHVNRAPAALRASAPSSSDSLPQVQPPYGFAVTYPCSNYWGDTRATVEGPTAFPYGSTRSIAPLPRSTRKVSAN